MESQLSLSQKRIGGDFILKETQASEIFIPEDFNEEQKMIRETIRTFIDTEITPRMESIEKLEDGVIPSILDTFAEYGFLGTHMPEKLGGSDLDGITNTLIGEEIGPSGSFSVSYNAHTGIGMLPILYYGTQSQKEKYIPKLIAGELKASYCLTEPTSGSDALAAKSTAILNESGTHYILNGQKMWITNAGFADIFTVFAQVDGHLFTGFIVEKGMPGFTLGAEEKKLGIKGSSTRQIFMENVLVPIANVLGEIGKGHLIAFNVLNTGRFKLGASTLGGSKKILEHSLRYALEREQFKQPIAQFGAVQYKLAEQAIRCFVTESSLYRTAQLMQDSEIANKEEFNDFGRAKLEAAEEFAIECSIIKIVGSETLDYVVDEAVQIFGGMGYSEEGNIARAYRDARINRIFEGTNEINRLVIMSTMLKSAMKGKLDLMTPGMAIQTELTQGLQTEELNAGPYNMELSALKNAKKALIMLLGTTAQQAMSGKLDLKLEQEVLMNLSDIIIDIFNMENTYLRVSKMNNESKSKDIKVCEAILMTYFHDAIFRIQKNGLDLIGSIIDPKLQATYITGLKKYTKYPVQNVKNNRRLITTYLMANKKYEF